MGSVPALEKGCPLTGTSWGRRPRTSPLPPFSDFTASTSLHPELQFSTVPSHPLFHARPKITYPEGISSPSGVSPHGCSFPK